VASWIEISCTHQPAGAASAGGLFVFMGANIWDGVIPSEARNLSSGGALATRSIEERSLRRKRLRDDMLKSFQEIVKTWNSISKRKTD
jgi:hypothetical protein